MTALAAALIGCAVVAGCGGGGSIRPQSSPQLIYVSSLIQDTKSLIPGVLTYTDVGSMRTGADTSFTVTVSGDAGFPTSSVSPSGEPSPHSGTYTYPSAVEVGATIGVQLICTGPITCTAESSERQNVLTATDSQAWTWDVTAGSPGTATVTVLATTYDQDSDNVLSETLPISQTVNVTATSGYVWGRIASWLQWLIGFIGAGALFSAGTWIFHRLRRRSAKKQGTDGAAPRAEAAAPEPVPASTPTPPEPTPPIPPTPPEPPTSTTPASAPDEEPKP